MIIHAIVPPSPDQWAMTVRNARNSWESWEKSDSYVEYAQTTCGRAIPLDYRLGEKDLALLTRLAVAGGDHGKFARALPVNIEAEVTEAMLRQLYTYRAGIMINGGEVFEPTDLMINATSVMHTAGRRPFVAGDLDMVGVRPDIAEQVVALMNEQRDYWIANGKQKPGDEWRGLVNLIPAGWKYTIHLSINYLVARAFFQSRRNHRLRDDWGVLCTALAQLPYSQIITTMREKV